MRNLEKLCGKCSKEQEMSKEERICLALSRMPNVVYRCPICTEEHSYQQIIRKVEIVVPKSEPKVEKKISARKKKDEEQQQLSLF